MVKKILPYALIGAAVGIAIGALAALLAPAGLTVWLIGGAAVAGAVAAALVAVSKTLEYQVSWPPAYYILFTVFSTVTGAVVYCMTNDRGADYFWGLLYVVFALLLVLWRLFTLDALQTREIVGRLPGVHALSSSDRGSLINLLPISYEAQAREVFRLMAQNPENESAAEIGEGLGCSANVVRWFYFWGQRQAQQ